MSDDPLGDAIRALRSYSIEHEEKRLAAKRELVDLATSGDLMAKRIVALAHSLLLQEQQDMGMAIPLQPFSLIKEGMQCRLIEMASTHLETFLKVLTVLRHEDLMLPDAEIQELEAEL